MSAWARSAAICARHHWRWGNDDVGDALFAHAKGETASGGIGAHILPELAVGRLRRVLFMATGALLSPTTTMQGESIPGVAHAVVLEHKEA